MRRMRGNRGRRRGEDPGGYVEQCGGAGIRRDEGGCAELRREVVDGEASVPQWEVELQSDSFLAQASCGGVRLTKKVECGCAQFCCVLAQERAGKCRGHGPREVKELRLDALGENRPLGLGGERGWQGD